MKKYKSLIELKAAYDSGELSKHSFLMIDNDSTPVYERAEDGEWLSDHCVFNGGNPECLLEEALTMLGIPWECA